MKEHHVKNHKKQIVAAGMLVAAAATGGAYALNSQPVNAEEAPTTSDAANNTDSTSDTSTRQKRELSAEKKAEIKEKLANMTEEEKQAWLESHKKAGGTRQDGKGPGKPADMSDEEWEQKKAERKAKLQEKLANMTEEEKAEWLANHSKKLKVSDNTENSDNNTETTN